MMTSRGRSKNTIVKALIVFLLLISLSLIFIWLDYKDYYNTDYRDLTKEQMAEIEWKHSYDSIGQKLKKAYIAQFNNKQFEFPRQKVNNVKLFRNIPVIGNITGKTLNQEQVLFILNYCNNPSNFDWGETTWSEWDSEYIFRFYNERGAVVGKLYACLKECRMTSSRPFSPRMKLGQLSEKGLHDINKLILEINGHEYIISTQSSHPRFS